jgi:hypothetical protein
MGRFTDIRQPLLDLQDRHLLTEQEIPIAPDPFTLFIRRFREKGYRMLAEIYKWE